MQTVFPYMACFYPSVSSRKQVKSQKMDLFSSPRAEVGVITIFCAVATHGVTTFVVKQPRRMHCITPRSTM